MFLSSCRKAVDTFAPPLGRSYRILRDATNRRKSVQTKYGFSLSGDPSMAREDWESSEIAVFLELMETHDAVLDIGANIGFYTCLAASRGKHTVSFEPSARNVNFLCKNLWQNQFREVEVFPLGLARQAGLGRIYGSGGIASFVPGWAQAREFQSTLVPLTTLDTITIGRFQNKKLLIKMDVEGFELDVLAGAAKTLDFSPKPTWLVEILFRDDLIPGGISQKFAEAFEVFWKHGYQCRKLDSSKYLVSQADVTRWIANGSMESDMHDFMFSAD
jgi:FkbM family methyltransferase